MNKNIGVELTVSVEKALKKGTTENGRCAIGLTQDDLALLSQDELTALTQVKVADPQYIALDRAGLGYSNVIRLNRHANGIEITVSTFDVEGVKEALAQMREVKENREKETKAKEDKEKAEYEKAAAVVLSTPVNGLLRCSPDCFGTNPNFWTSPISNSIDLEKSPELTDKIREVKAEITARNQEEQIKWKAKEAQKKAEKEAKEEAHKKINAEAQKQFNAFIASGHVSLEAERAVKENYEVTKSVIDAVIDQLPAYTEKLWQNSDRRRKSFSWEERANPNNDAFTLYDSLVESVKTLNKPECVKVEVSRIQHIEYDAHYDNHNCDDEDRNEDYERTGIVVSISSPITQTYYLLYFSE